MKIWLNGFAKFAAVFRISLHNQLAYFTETGIRSFFLVVILYVFAQLWATTYQATGHQSLAGYGVRDVVWYLVVTEAIVMGTPPLVPRLSEEIKQGDIAYRLIRPISYIGYNYAQYLAESTVRILINLLLGGLVASLCTGLPKVTLVSVCGFLGACIVALSAQFFMNMFIGLLLFWLEDGFGLQLILSRMVMILGGMMIPLPLFPHWLSEICTWLPFQAVAYLPARTFVAIHLQSSVTELVIAVVWVFLFAVLCRLLYAKGVKQLHVQGG